MPEGALQSLFSEDLQAVACTIAGAPALREFFLSRAEVRAVEEALRSGTLTDPAVRQFVEDLLDDLEQGVRFPHDRSLAALAVALGNRYTPFAEEYLQGLARLEAAELPYSTRVAREVLSRRQALAKVLWVARPAPSESRSDFVEDYREFSQRYPTRAKNKADLVA